MELDNQNEKKNQGNERAECTHSVLPGNVSDRPPTVNSDDEFGAIITENLWMLRQMARLTKSDRAIYICKKSRAYSMEVIVGFDYNRDIFQIGIELVPSWWLAVYSWFLGMPLAKTVDWMFEIESDKLIYLPGRIKAFCRENEWWNHGQD